MSGVKRKASDFKDDHNTERPGLVKRRTYTFGTSPDGGNISPVEACQTTEGSAGFLSNITTSTISSPGIEAFQRKITEFCVRYGPLFGTSYASGLQHSHSEVYVEPQGPSFFMPTQLSYLFYTKHRSERSRVVLHSNSANNPLSIQGV